jgi:hypothetical protein
MDPASAKQPVAKVDPRSGRTPEQDRAIDDAIAEALRGQPPLTKEELDVIRREWDSQG